jgi:hypothetical protein
MAILPIQMQLNVYPPVTAFGDWIAAVSYFGNRPALGKPANMALLPIPAEFPPELPRLIMGFPDVGLRLEASALAWTIRWLELPTARRDDAYALEKRKLAAVELLEAAGHFRVRIVRLASVAVWAISDLPDPAKFLAQRFFKVEYLVAPLDRPQALEIHSHKVFKFEPFTVNSWARLKTENLVQPDPSWGNGRVVTFASDLNTVLAENSEFSLDGAQQFFAATWPEHLEVRKLYLGE